jgi:hypothetical protein
MAAADPEPNEDLTHDPFRLQVCIPVDCNIVDIPSGSGTLNDPYIIITKSNWTAVAGYIAADNSTYTYIKLNNDLVFTASDTFTPIGTEAMPFYGEFDGQSNTISGVQTFTSSLGTNVGLFASAHQSVIKNINVENFTCLSPTVKSYAGSVLGYGTDVTLQNITVKNITLGNFSVIGGVVGHARRIDLENVSTVMKDIQVSGVNLNAVANGTVPGVAGGVAGEFIGEMGDSSLTSGYDIIVQAGTNGSASVANVISGTNFAGGAVGRSFRPNSSDPVTSVYSRVNVSGSTLTASSTSTTTSTIVCAGGLLGYANSTYDSVTVSNCIIQDDVTVTGTHVNLAAGGIMGGSLPLQ